MAQVLFKIPPRSRPAIINGMGQSLPEGELQDITFRSNATFSDFIRVEIDGKTVDESNYTVKEGSTIVILKADYVKTISVGQHTFGIVSEGGTATTAFTVNTKATNNNSPKTSDNNHIYICFAFAVLSVSMLTVMEIYRKKKKIL